MNAFTAFLSVCMFPLIHYVTAVREHQHWHLETQPRSEHFASSTRPTRLPCGVKRKNIAAGFVNCESLRVAHGSVRARKKRQG
jgi:hypothetical protein